MADIGAASAVLFVGLLSLLEGALQVLGVGGQIGVAALLSALAIYARKFVSVGSRLRNVVGYGMVFAILLAILLAVGWARLDIGAIQSGIGGSLSFIGEQLGGLDLGGIVP